MTENAAKTGLERVIELANTLVEQAEALEKAETSAKRLKKELLKTERETLPDIMTELGLTELKLASGQTIEVQPDCDAAITEKTREKALQWLEENGFGGLIKTEVSVSFDRGQEEAAKELLGDLRDRGMDAGMKRNVHPITLKAFVKEQLKDGKPIPMDLFNVRPYSKAIIKKGKGK